MRSVVEVTQALHWPWSHDVWARWRRHREGRLPTASSDRLRCADGPTGHRRTPPTPRPGARGRVVFAVSTAPLHRSLRRRVLLAAHRSRLLPL